MMVCAKRIFLLTCFLICSTSSSGEQEIKGKPGDDVILQCQGPRDVVVQLLRWKKPDLRSDNYVFYYRDEKQFENYQHPSYRGRVELKDPKMKDGDFSVILKNININDVGTYECYVGNGNGNGKSRLRLINTMNLIIELGQRTRKIGAGGNKDEGDKERDGGNTTVIGVVIPVVLVLLLVVVVGIVGFWFYKKQRGSTDQSSYQQPLEQRIELQTV